MQKYKCLFIVLVLLVHQMLGQKDTTNPPLKNPLLKQLLLPSVLILTGSLLTGKELEKNWQVDIRDKVGNDYYNSMDDYLQYLPYGQVFLGDLIGIKAKNHWFDQSKNMFIGGITTLVITHALKRGVGKERPDLSSNHSFSSGHTATAFLGGTILYHEYKESSMLYASSGYLFSVSAGSLRVVNNRHWVSDVLAGAGIGILVGNLIYHIEPLKNWNPFKGTKNISFSPIITTNEMTFIASLTF